MFTVNWNQQFPGTTSMIMLFFVLFCFTKNGWNIPNMQRLVCTLNYTWATAYPRMAKLTVRNLKHLSSFAYFRRGSCLHLRDLSSFACHSFRGACLHLKDLSSFACHSFRGACLHLKDLSSFACHSFRGSCLHFLGRR